MNWKKYLPHAVAVVVFVLLTAVFFKPLVFDGQMLKQSDIESHAGMAKEIADYRAAHNGQEPLWTNSMFSGMPAYFVSTRYPGNVTDKVNDFFRVIIPHPATTILLSLIGFYFLLLVFGVDALVAGIGAIGFAFASFSFIVLTAGHNSEAYAMAYMGPVMMGILLSFRGYRLLGGALAALALALEIGAGHIQITYYLMIVAVVLTTYEFYRHYTEKKLKDFAKTSAVLAVALVLGVLPNITNLVLGQQYLKYSTRGATELKTHGAKENKTGGLDFDYATQWSLGKTETMTLLIPDFYGGASKPVGDYAPGVVEKVFADDEKTPENVKQLVGTYARAYFGPQQITSGPVYAGAIICLLFLLAFFVVDDKIKWWLLGLTILSILLAWGRFFEGFNLFVFNHLPYYNKFRAVTMTLVIAQFVMPILAALAINEIAKNPEKLKAKLKYFYGVVGLLGVICLFVWLSPSTFVTPSSKDSMKGMGNAFMQNHMINSMEEFDQYASSVRKIQLGMTSSDAMRSLLFILAAGGLIWAFVRYRFSKMIFVGGLAVLCLVDLWFVGTRYISDEPSHVDQRVISQSYHEKPAEGADAVAKTKADAMILQDTTKYYRVYTTDDPFQNSDPSYYHKMIGGYSAAKMKRYQELYDYQYKPKFDAYGQAMRQYYQQADSGKITQQQISLLQQDGLRTQYVMNMLNTRYIIYDAENGNVQRNPYAYGNAWFVRDVKIVPDADAELDEVGKTDPHYTAIVDKRFEKEVAGFKPAADSNATIRLTTYEANHLAYRSNAASEQLAVFSDIYYDKGWNAYVDGKLMPHFRTDYVLRAMRIPAGSHTIDFKFEPTFYGTGESISMFSSLLLFAAVAGGVFFEIRRRQKNKTATAEDEA